jgi:hypothetical protein
LAGKPLAAGRLTLSGHGEELGQGETGAQKSFNNRVWPQLQDHSRLRELKASITTQKQTTLGRTFALV